MATASGPNAFGAAVAGEIPRLRLIARTLVRQPEAVEDLVQDTLLRAIAARQQFDPRTDLRTWLIAILHSRRRAQARRETLSPLLATALEATPWQAGPPVVSGGQEERAAMRDLAAALARLPRPQRQALALVAGEGLGYAQAARRLRIPLGTLRSRLSRARARLRRSDLEGAPPGRFPSGLPGI